MIIYILNIKPSLKSVSETKLTRDGIWMKGFDPLETAYEMCIDVYASTINDSLKSPEKTIIVGEEFYRGLLEKYSSDELLQGIKLESLLSVLNPISLDKDLLFEEEVRVIAHNIMESIDYADSDRDFLSTIKREILSLKDKFKIYPK